MASFDVSLPLGISSIYTRIVEKHRNDSLTLSVIGSEPAHNNYININNGIHAIENVEGNIIIAVLNNVEVTTTITTELVSSLLESLSLASVIFTTGTYHLAIQEAIAQNDLTVPVISLVLQESLTIDDIVANYQLYKDIVQDYCTINGVVFTTGAFHVALSAALLILDVTGHLNEIVLESIQIDETLLDLFNTFLAIFEDLEISSTVSNTLSIFSIISESSTLDDSSSNIGNLKNQILEQIRLTLAANIEGVVYEGWLLNPENFAVWNYNSFDFNSMTAYKDRYLMANSSGLYELEGNQDDGTDIISKLKTVSFDFGTSNLKQISDIILGIDNSGRLVLKVSTDGDQTVYYELKPSTNNYQNQRVKLGKGLYGRYWQFELITKDNSTFDLDTFEVLPFLFNRKLR